ncbi:putative HNH endonuclease protein [Rhizobium phage RHEph12]|nr:putative HNH endonuclease protein [Rhizobium phage RHEph12]
MQNGDLYPTKNSGNVVVVNYENSKSVLVRFVETGYETNVTAKTLREGYVRDLYHRSVCGVGFVGEGKYAYTSHKKLYTLWSNMLMRCYDPDYQRRYPTYIGCSVVDRWHCLQTFCRDITKMDNWNARGFELDKDLRVLGNKVYGPRFCSFVPHDVNSVVVKADSEGIEKRNNGNGDLYYARLTLFGKSTYFPCDSEEDARLSYKLLKAKYVKMVGEYYRHVIHPQVYYNMRRFKCIP